MWELPQPPLSSHDRRRCQSRAAGSALQRPLPFEQPHNSSKDLAGCSLTCRLVQSTICPCQYLHGMPWHPQNTMYFGMQWASRDMVPSSANRCSPAELWSNRRSSGACKSSCCRPCWGSRLLASCRCCSFLSPSCVDSLTGRLPTSGPPPAFQRPGMPSRSGLCAGLLLTAAC